MVKKVLLIASLAAALVSCADDENAMQDPTQPGDASASTDNWGVPSAPELPSASGLIGDAAKTVTQQAPQQAKNGGTRYVAVHSLYVRSSPSMSSKPVGVLQFNQPFQVHQIVGNQGTWFKIGEGQFVGSRYTSPNLNSQMMIPHKYSH